LFNITNEIERVIVLAGFEDFSKGRLGKKNVMASLKSCGL
jgi:hypothetical protein